MTAAHCLVGKDPRYFEVYSGSIHPVIKVKKHKVKNIMIHEDYQLIQGGIASINDIGLIELMEPLIFDEYQKPIPLFDVDEKIEQNGILWVW